MLNFYLWIFIGVCVSLKSANGDCYYAKNECPNKDVQFWFYKKDTIQSPLFLNPLNITRSMLAPKESLIVLIHGSNLNKDKSPNAEMREMLLQNMNVDIISLDFEPLVRLPCWLPWSRVNARVVAKCLGHLLNTLVMQNIYEPHRIHLIGFSLGAQVAGLSTNHLNFKLSRISGLDPGTTGFVTKNKKQKLDATDAYFVDIIHTDPYLLSNLNRMGHVDFYPNVGALIQPGCNFLERPGVCNHFRAVVYYAESILSKVGFWSTKCANISQYNSNQCSSSAERQLMGFHANENARGSYFLKTNSKSPFALG